MHRGYTVGWSSMSIILPNASKLLLCFANIKLLVKNIFVFKYHLTFKYFNKIVVLTIQMSFVDTA